MSVLLWPALAEKEMEQSSCLRVWDNWSLFSCFWRNRVVAQVKPKAGGAASCSGHQHTRQHSSHRQAGAETTLQGNGFKTFANIVLLNSNSFTLAHGNGRCPKPSGGWSQLFASGSGRSTPAAGRSGWPLSLLSPPKYSAVHGAGLRREGSLCFWWRCRWFQVDGKTSCGSSRLVLQRGQSISSETRPLQTKTTTFVMDI